jgi:hypothetical protein
MPMAHCTVFTDEVMLTVRRLVHLGYRSPEIAEAIGVSPQSLRSTCSRRGISLVRRPGDEPESTDSVRLFLSEECRARLRAAAERRGLGFTELAVLLLETVARDELVGAVING